MEQASTLVTAFRQQVSQGLHLQNIPTITVSTLLFLHCNYCTCYEEYYFRCSFLCVQVFLDEINTSSCLGYLKEIIADRMMDGQVLEYLLE